MSPHPVAATLTPAGRRALSAFLEGRLPAGRLHEELLRAAMPEQPVAVPLPHDTASMPVPPPVPAVAAA
jgi:hypothetical protein